MATIKSSKGRKRIPAPKASTKTKTKIIFRDREGGDTKVEPLSVTKNGNYTAPAGTAYSPVSVNVNESSPVSDFIIECSISSGREGSTITAEDNFSYTYGNLELGNPYNRHSKVAVITVGKEYDGVMYYRGAEGEGLSLEKAYHSFEPSEYQIGELLPCYLFTQNASKSESERAIRIPVAYKVISIN